MASCHIQFRFSKCGDKALICAGLFSAVMTGVSLPMNLLLVSYILDSLVDYEA